MFVILVGILIIYFFIFIKIHQIFRKTVRPEDVNQQEEGSPHEDTSAPDTDADGMF